MTTDRTPNYLSSLVPPTVGSLNRYPLRNAEDFQVMRVRTALYSNSFLPSVVREFNSLPVNTRNADSVASFKRMISL